MILGDVQVYVLWLVMALFVFVSDVYFRFLSLKVETEVLNNSNIISNKGNHYIVLRLEKIIIINDEIVSRNERREATCFERYSFETVMCESEYRSFKSFKFMLRSFICVFKNTLNCKFHNNVTTHTVYE